MSNENKTNYQNQIPFNLEAEKYIIGSLMLFEDAYEKIAEVGIQSDDLYDTRNQILFSTIKSLKDSNKPAQLIALTEALRTAKQLDKAGGADYISSLTDDLPTSAYIKHYLEIIKKKSILRKLISTSNSLIADCYDEPDDVQSLLDTAEKKILDINQDMFTNSLAHIKDVVSDAIKIIQTRTNNDGEMSGVPSGFYDLDEKTDGFQKSELIIVAARPSVGKTAFALNLLTNMAINSHKNYSIGMFSCEMSHNSLMVRMLCSEAKVDQTLYRKNLLSQQDKRRLIIAADKFYESKIIFDDTPGISIHELRSKARKMKREWGIEALIIDYLQLVSFGNELNSSVPRHEQIAYISKALKSLSRELDIPVIALAQLNRNVEQRTGGNSQPKMSDLKDSGSIEQDADVVMFLHRKETEDDVSGMTESRELIIGKNRNGPTDVIDLVFFKSFTRFQLATKDSYSEE